MKKFIGVLVGVFTLAGLLFVFNVPVFASHTASFNIGARSFNVYTPAGFAGGDAVMVLHGSGGNSSEIAKVTGFDETADENGFAVLYPQGSGSVSDWNGGGCCGSAVTDQVDDVEFLSSVAGQVKHDFKVNRVFVVGFSSGGIMAYRLGCETSGVFAGVGVHSGSLTMDSCENKDKLPLLHVHGVSDSIVPVAGGAGPDLYDFVSLYDSVGMFAKKGSKVKVDVVQGEHGWFNDSTGKFVDFFNL